jgi:hypothetical protein
MGGQHQDSDIAIPAIVETRDEKGLLLLEV